MSTHWIILYLAIALEICGTLCLKLANGFTRPLPTVMVLLAYSGSFYCMSKAMRYIEVGMAYAIWSAVGIVVIALLSLILFDEHLTPPKVLAYLLIIGGVVVLNLSPEN